MNFDVFIPWTVCNLERIKNWWKHWWLALALLWSVHHDSSVDMIIFAPSSCIQACLEMSFSLFLHLQYFCGFQETLSWSGQSEQLGWLQYNYIVWIELRSVRYTFVKFKMIPNDCMETRTLFMIDCSKMFDMCSAIHPYIIFLIDKFCYRNL